MKIRVQKALVLSAALATAATTAAVPATDKSQKPVAYMVSDAHLDTQWNWDIQTTIGEYVWNTLNQDLFLRSPMGC